MIAHLSPLTNHDEREIVTAILEALNLVDQMQGSHKDFIDVLEFAEKTVFKKLRWGTTSEIYVAKELEGDRDDLKKMWLQ